MAVMAVDGLSSPSTTHYQPAPPPPHQPPFITPHDSQPSTDRAVGHIRHRSTSLTFHPAVRATHQRNLSRSLSIFIPPTANTVHAAHAYVPSQRASQPANLAPPRPTAPPAPPPPAAVTAVAPAAASSIHRSSLTGFDSSSYKVLLVGAPHSGKTCLLQRLIAQYCDDTYTPTQRIELALYLLRDEQFNSLEVTAQHTQAAQQHSWAVFSGSSR